MRDAILQHCENVPKKLLSVEAAWLGCYIQTSFPVLYVRNTDFANLPRNRDSRIDRHWSSAPGCRGQFAAELVPNAPTPPLQCTVPPGQARTDFLVRPHVETFSRITSHISTVFIFQTPHLVSGSFLSNFISSSFRRKS